MTLTHGSVHGLRYQIQLSIFGSKYLQIEITLFCNHLASLIDPSCSNLFPFNFSVHSESLITVLLSNA